MERRSAGPVRTLLADDHPVVRAGVRALLEGLGECAVVAEADSGPALAAQADAHASVLDLIVMDIRMPQFDPMASIAELRRRRPGVKILVLSSYAAPGLVQDLLHAGANGYVLKDESWQLLGAAVRAVLDGTCYLSPRIAELYVRRQRSCAEAGGALRLTGREREVLALLGAGCDNQTISAELRISGETVKNHLRNIYQKLGCAHRYEAIVYALRNGLAREEVAW